MGSQHHVKLYFDHRHTHTKKPWFKQFKANVTASSFKVSEVFETSLLHTLLFYSQIETEKKLSLLFLLLFDFQALNEVAIELN